MVVREVACLKHAAAVVIESSYRGSAGLAFCPSMCILVVIAHLQFIERRTNRAFSEERNADLIRPCILVRLSVYVTLK